MITKIEMTYCTNYNGCYGYIHTDEKEPVEVDDHLIESIVNLCADEVNEYGEFYGDDIEDLIKVMVHNKYGNDIKVEVIIDETSS